MVIRIAVGFVCLLVAFILAVIEAKRAKMPILGAAVAICLLIAGIGLSAGWYEAGQRSKTLPSLEGSCRGGPIQVSWRVSDGDYRKLSKAVKSDAKCDITITRVPPPPPFPKEP